MKKANFITAFILLALLLLNVGYFLNVNKRFVSYLNSSLEQQVDLCGSYMESQLEGFENDLNRLLFEYPFSSIFKNREEMDRTRQSLQLFYAKYRDLISNVYIFDDNKNYFGLYIDDGDQIVVDSFPRQRQQELNSRVRVEFKEGKYLYHFPYFQNDKVSGNVVVETNFIKFAERIFSFYPIGKIISWQWVINEEGKVFSKDFSEGYTINSLAEITDSIDMFAVGLIDHSIIDESGKKIHAHSAYYPLSIFNQNLGIVFTSSRANFNRYFMLENLLVTIAAYLITLSLIIYLLILLGRHVKSREKLILSEINFRQIIEHIPVGILILNKENTILNLNSGAMRLLFADTHENLVGQNFSNQFLVSNKYLLTEASEGAEKSDYLYYEKDGQETVIFRMENITRVGGDELKIMAMIDVSSIERSRKQEVAANKAKSDFLASMSHEIRTPMNGILGMVASLLDSKLPAEATEKVKIIKKSSDLLLTIINDLLDFSKIEAGKMMLEEIPFSLSEEIGIVHDLFRPLAEEKGLKIELELDRSVPEKLIGDPFRLRQVISNLVSNSIKFTETGKISIGAKVMEAFNGRLQLLFWVEDTGIGIPEDKIGSIFSTYSQSRGSVSRKFGGTGLGTAISKQLVELMNGEIWVESPSGLAISEEAPGSRFSFTIEVYSNEKLVKKFDYSRVHRLNDINALFLTKESNPEKSNSIRLLSQFGIEIVTKIYQDSTIDAVVHHLSKKQDFYHLIIIADKSNLEGFAIASRLNEEGLIDHFPTIMLSNNDQPGNYKITRKLRVDHYLIEPFENKEIFDIIKETYPGLKDLENISPKINALPDELSILLAEDNLINQKVAQSIFKNIGYEIDIASNGAQAIEKAKDNRYDVIFMDLLMPEVDGFEATIQIRKMGLKIPIIAMSADGDDERKSEAVRAGMDEFLVKPAKVESVKHVLIKLFSSRIE